MNLPFFSAYLCLTITQTLFLILIYSCQILTVENTFEGLDRVTNTLEKSHNRSLTWIIICRNLCELVKQNVCK